MPSKVEKRYGYEISSENSNYEFFFEFHANDSECRGHLTSQGFENWGQINLDLKKLETHFKGKILGNDVSLIAALDKYNRKTILARPQSEIGLGGNPLRILWELKGIKWPSIASIPESSTTCNATSSHAKQLQPTTMQEEQEQLKTALI